MALFFYPCCNQGTNMQWVDWHLPNTESLVVYITDYNTLLLKHLQQVFPLTDPVSNQTQECFDVCFDNWIGRATWLLIIESMKCQLGTIQTEKESRFLSEFIFWIKQQLEWADIIVVEGNQ